MGSEMCIRDSILFERSLQAQFLKPMAISIGFGVLFATFITLVLVPVLYLILEDFRTLLGLRQEKEHEPKQIGPARL